MSASLNDKITDVRNSARPESTTATGTRAANGDTLACASLAGWPTASKVHFVTYQTDTNNDVIAGTQLDCYGIVSGNSITNFTVIDGTDGGNSIGDKVEMLPTAAWGQDLADALTASHNRDGTLKDGAVDSADVLAANVVTTAKILDDNITTAKILAANVTLAKLEAAIQTKLGYLTAPASSWTVPTYLNSWHKYDTTYNEPAYYKDAFGFVHLRGMIAGGSSAGAAMFILPAGYRPILRVLTGVHSATGFARLDIETNGTVALIGSGSTSWTSLECVTFKAEL